MKKKAEHAAVGLALQLANRYVLTALVGLIWAAFVSDIDLIFLAKSQMELSRLEAKSEKSSKKQEATFQDPAISEQVRFAKHQAW